MATLIAAYNSEGCTARCDANCYNATGPHCQCICGGMNHGKGHNQAVQNTADHAQAMMEQWQAQHPETTRFIKPHAQQLQLPLET